MEHNSKLNKQKTKQEIKVKHVKKTKVVTRCNLGISSVEVRVLHQGGSWGAAGL